MRTLSRIPLVHGIVLAGYAALVFAGIRHHEPWFDEAQSWLMARDLGLTDLLFHQIRYEGTPGLWTVLLWFANVLHLPYAALGVIGGICAVAGTFVFLRYAPFPDAVKFLLPFSFFFAYQYAVVARSYTLIPLLAFSAAHLYKRATLETYRFTLALALLANVSAHGVAIAVGIALAYAWQLAGIGGWNTLDAKARQRHILAAAFFCATLLSIVAMVLPPKDANFYAVQQQVSIESALHTALSAISGALVGSVPISAAILLVLAVWSFIRTRTAVFLLPVGLLLALFIRVWAQPWHHGTLLVAIIAALWISWPTPEERRRFDLFAAASHFAVVGVLVAAFCFQLSWTVKTFVYDWSHPFSGSRDAAYYLKSVGADQKKTVALGFSTTAILPYFQDNIFLNEAQLSRQGFWHWSTANDASQTPESFLAIMPDYAVVGWKRDEELAEYELFMQTYGYSLVHQSTGEMYFKDAVQQPDSYRVYSRSVNVEAHIN